MADANDNTTEVHRKLLRDNIPDVIRANDGTPRWHTLVDDSEYLAALHVKVVEEARELQDASPEERVDELADFLDVTTALMAALGITEAEVKQAAERKRVARGGFECRICLEHVEHVELGDVFGTYSGKWGRESNPRPRLRNGNAGCAVVDIQASGQCRRLDGECYDRDGLLRNSPMGAIKHHGGRVAAGSNRELVVQRHVDGSHSTFARCQNGL